MGRKPYDLYVKQQCLVRLSTLREESGSHIEVAPCFIVHSYPYTVITAGIAAHKPHICIHLSVRLRNLKCLLGLLCHQQELHSCLHNTELHYIV